jgi:hypothetical protein
MRPVVIIEDSPAVEEKENKKMTEEQRMRAIAIDS